MSLLRDKIYNRKFMTELSFKSNLICVAAEGYSLTYPVSDYRLGAWLGDDLSPHLPARTLPSPGPSLRATLHIFPTFLSGLKGLAFSRHLLETAVT